VPGIRFDHIAVAQHRIADLAPFLGGVLGGVPDYGAPSGAYQWGQWRFANGGRIEVLEPVGADGFLHRFLGRYGPSVHHVTFRVPSLEATCARARAHGYDIVGYDASDPHWKEAFLHPKQALGIVVQFAEARAGGSRRWQPPPAPANPPPPASVVGLRMRAHARERADRQWLDVLEGERTGQADGTLIYRWPRSPMRIVVAIDPAADEGPVCIELASERALPLDGSQATPGIQFSLNDRREDT